MSRLWFMVGPDVRSWSCQEERNKRHLNNLMLGLSKIQDINGHQWSCCLILPKPYHVLAGQSIDSKGLCGFLTLEAGNSYMWPKLHNSSFIVERGSSKEPFLRGWNMIRNEASWSKQTPRLQRCFFFWWNTQNIKT